MNMRIIMWILKLLDTGCCRYSKSIADRGVGRIISWLDTAEPVDCFNKSFDFYILQYIDLFQILLVGYSHLLVGLTLGYAFEMRHSTNLQDFKSLTS